MKILIVDDSLATLDTFVAMFELSGYVAYPAANVKSALSHLEQRPEINLIIVDYCMPIENGMVFCEKVRASGRKVPILVLTAVDDDTVEELERRCDLLGNIRVLKKPFKPERLLALIAKIKEAVPDDTVLKRV